ncbi:hypothetical protein ACF07B_08245 [Streptomyces sp. NPDC015532]|uniref:hypothetical protein n=1 Tax=Streptomyces sp. NPDC015532 TaxID=3364960 RepID=UPI0036F9D89C
MKIAGRKCHIGVGIRGLLLAVWVAAVSAFGSVGGIRLMSCIAFACLPREHGLVRHRLPHHSRMIRLPPA